MRRMLTGIVIAILCCYICCSCSQTSGEKTFSDETAIDGIDISGLTYAQAQRLVEKRHDDLLCEINYTVDTKGSRVIFTAKEVGVAFDTHGVLEAAAQGGGDYSAKLVLDENIARERFRSIEGLLTTEAISASAEYDAKGEFSFFKSRDGEAPDIDSMVESLKNSLSCAKSEKLLVKMTATKASGATYEQLVASNTLLAEFKTSFAGNPYNAKGRVNNILKAAKLVNGTVIADGENFDTNAVLGYRNEKNGWSKAPGIRNGKYNLEYGGGVCQVSTTLYNAALLCNLEIVERTHHSWPIGYVDIGRDATISSDGPNLVIKNNTGGDITIAALVNDDKTELTIRIFGKKSNEYAYAQISSKQTGTISAPKTEYVYDKTLMAGEYVKDRDARAGKKAITYRKFFDENGKLIRTETVSKDTYKAFAAVVRYGK